MAGIWINDKKLQYVSAWDITERKLADERSHKHESASWVKETIAIADKCNKEKSSGDHEIWNKSHTAYLVEGEKANRAWRLLKRP